MFAGLDFYRLPFSVGGTEQSTFARIHDDGSIFRSIIDHVFFSSDFISLASNTQLGWEFQSPHLILGWLLRVEGLHDVDSADSEAEDRECLTLDMAKVVELSQNSFV
jgi:hypothetical protein